jgi:hypothetical protein
MNVEKFTNADRAEFVHSIFGEMLTMAVETTIGAQLSPIIFLSI